MTELASSIKSFVENLIISFESGMYKMVLESNPERIRLFSDKYQPFIAIYRDIHEIYYTNACNSIIKRDDHFIVEQFNKFCVLSKYHNSRCILNIIANLAVTVHFNLNRKKLDHTTLDKLVHSLKLEIADTIRPVDIDKLFEHNCVSKPLEMLENGDKFIEITISNKPITNDKIDS
jgi:hypothetical protein